MADKRKPNSADERPLESDRQFLERTNVGHLIRDVLDKLISNRPEEPIGFLADYFDTVEDQSNLVTRARQILLMTHHSRPVFESNVRISYDILKKHKVGKKLHGVNGNVYTDLVKSLSRDLPQSIVIKLLKKLECNDYESVPYDIYRSGVFTCCVLQDYVKLTKLLFESIDVQKAGKADKALCDTVLDQLKAALASNRNDPRKIVESGYNLGPDGLYYALERAMKRDHKGHGVQTLEQFTVDACEAFLLKVKKMR